MSRVVLVEIVSVLEIASGGADRLLMQLLLLILSRLGENKDLVALSREQLVGNASSRAWTTSAGALPLPVRIMPASNESLVCY